MRGVPTSGHVACPARTGCSSWRAILRTLADAGLDESLVYRGYHAVTMHIVGFTIQALGYRDFPLGEDLADVAETFLSSLATADLPHLAEHVRGHLDDHDHGDEFSFVLGLILDGLERANAATS